MYRKLDSTEISRHDNPSDCWLVVNGRVYDLTTFASEHPGGARVIYDFAGKDATDLYNLYHAKNLIEDTLGPKEKKGLFDASSRTQELFSTQKALTQRVSPSQQGKPPLETLLNLYEFEQAFSKHGDPRAGAYIASASNDLLTLVANKNAWQKLWFRPRVLRDVSAVNTQTKMLRFDVSMPVWICPMGIGKTAGPMGELALGAGAASRGIVHCMSTTASFGVHELLTNVPKSYPYFFQLYVDKNRKRTEKMLQDLELQDQIRALFVTVDLAVVSKREADERLKVEDSGGSVKKGGGVARKTGSFIDPALSWDDLCWVRTHSTKPLIIKGIQSAADAKRALDLGCQGIVISNHGGRALDSAPATALILLEIRRDCPYLFDRLEVFVDGGIRRGSDILKAVLLGARGVGVGRPFQCSIMYGQEGVEAVADILLDELQTAMRLCGIKDLNKVRGDTSYLNMVGLQQLLPRRPRSRLWPFRSRSKL